MVGMACAINITETSTAAATAVGGSVLLMLVFRCLHPPAAATSLTPITAGPALTSLGYSFVIVPVAINVFTMLFLAIFINRWVMKRNYPSELPIKKEVNQRHNIVKPTHKIGFSEQDLELALDQSDIFIDMTHSQLSQLLSTVEMNTFQRIKGSICCADIMIRDVISVEFGTEVEDAWQIMQDHHLKAMPVVNNIQRVIGIITWNDFFKCIDLNTYDSFQDKFRRFIRRTPSTNASKPEAVGLIMTSEVISLPDTTHIADLIPLMSVKGIRQIPIVDSERRLSGMVYQANLIAALYNQELAAG